MVEITAPAQAETIHFSCVPESIKAKQSAYRHTQSPHRVMYGSAVGQQIVDETINRTDQRAGTALRRRLFPRALQPGVAWRGGVPEKECLRQFARQLWYFCQVEHVA